MNEVINAPAGEREQLEVTAVIGTPEPLVAVPPAPVEQTYSWQPSDESGRPMGGKQVIKYTSQEEFAQKFTEQNNLLIRKLREETRKNRLGITDEETLPEGTQLLEAPINFTPRELSLDERMKLTREMSDPETFDQAADTLLEARLGAKPSVVAGVISELQRESTRNRALMEAESFVRSNPDYIVCNENGSAIAKWMQKRNLAPVQANMQKAFETLKGAGVLLVASESIPTPSAIVEPEPVVPLPAVEPPVEPTPVEPLPIVEPPTPTPTAPKVRIPTGLTRQQATDAGTARPLGEDVVYIAPDGRKFTGLAALDAMPADLLKHRNNTEKGFREKAEALWATETVKKSPARK